MASHLTVSIELISFMKWVLKNKQPQLKSFVKEMLSDGLRDEIVHAAHKAPSEVNIDTLYGVVDEFLSAIENEIVEGVAHKYLMNKEKVEDLNELRDYSEVDESENSSALSSDDFYKSLTAQTRAQLNAISKDKEMLSHSMHEAAQRLNSDERPYSDNAKKHAVIRALIENWSPEESNDIN